MFKISDLLEYDNIVIQCHDNPDADTIASAFGVYTYLIRHGKSVRIVYSGNEQIERQNIRLMVDLLNIPLEYVGDNKPKPKLLVCVDCQYGEIGVTPIEADEIAIIDHHAQVYEEFELGSIQSNLGSCATLVWALLRREEFDFESDKAVATALYYGLYTNSNNLSEVTHPLDKDLLDNLTKYCDLEVIKRLNTCSMSIQELKTASEVLAEGFTNTEKRFTIFKVDGYDTGLLGFICDFAIQIDTIDVCVAYCLRDSGAKVSVRSCTNYVMASDFIQFLIKDVGSGGGQKERAGGWLQKELVEGSVDEYIKQKTAEYFDSYDIVVASEHNFDTSKMTRYRKKHIPKGFVVTTDVFEENTPLMIRMLEGDKHIKASPDVFLIIGILGEVHPLEAEKFHSMYKLCNEPVDMDENIYYVPTAKNEITGETREILPYMKPCMPFWDSPIFAEPLKRNIKIFNNRLSNDYMHGMAGDYLAVKCDDLHDIYVIRKDIFFQTYEEE